MAEITINQPLSIPINYDLILTDSDQVLVGYGNILTDDLEKQEG